ncbi:Plant UBX domain-containing protein 2, partial [Mucuna pruriens]
MGDMKDKMKGFMKKVNNPFSSSSSGKFKGQGRVLGSSSSSSTPTNSNPTPRPIPTQNPNPNPNPKPKPKPTSATANPKPLPQKMEEPNRITEKPRKDDGFDPFDSLLTNSKRSQNGYSLNVYECPVCKQPFRSEEEVAAHVDDCLSNPVERGGDNGNGFSESEVESNSELEVCVGTYISGKPSEGSVDVVLKLLRNIGREPENVKFRRIRMNNPKIKEAVGDVAGGIEMLSFVGFELREESGETWAVMEVPTQNQINFIKKAIVLLESQLVQGPPKREDSAPATSAQMGAKAEPKPVDRQLERGGHYGAPGWFCIHNAESKVKVFFAVPESVAAKIELPDSFYNLSAEEVRREAELRRKKIADSQLLIPKSLKEKQAKASMRRYTKAIIRIQFPDGVVLQGVFAPWESTTALYEFVSSALKEPCLEFELMHPVLVQRRAIPHFPKAGENAKTIEEENLVPSALIKFKPLETDSVVFTGLKNELLEISEPLAS